MVSGARTGDAARAPHVNAEVVDRRLVEVVDAQDDVALAVLPGPKVRQVLVARDPGPRRRPADGRPVGELRLREADLLEVVLAPAADDEVVPEEVRRAAVEGVRVLGDDGVLRRELVLRLARVARARLVFDPGAARVRRRRLPAAFHVEDEFAVALLDRVDGGDDEAPQAEDRAQAEADEGVGAHLACWSGCGNSCRRRGDRREVVGVAVDGGYCGHRRGDRREAVGVAVAGVYGGHCS